MNRHLSSGEVSRWVLGERSQAGADRHLTECSSCRAEITRFEEALAGFRKSARSWSDGEMDAHFPHPAMLEPRKPRITHSGLIWAGVSMTVLLVIAISLSWNMSRPKLADSAAADAALLIQVDAEVSRTVPAPMEPLAKLVLWDVSSNPQGARPQQTGKNEER
jgi:anti-sigma factor RsiW